MDRLKELELRGLELALVIFPKPYLLSKATNYLLFKKIRADLVFNTKPYWLFYQDEKYLPFMDEYEYFNKQIHDLESICQFIDVAVEWKTNITKDDGFKDHIILLGVMAPTPSKLKKD